MVARGSTLFRMGAALCGAALVLLSTGSPQATHTTARNLVVIMADDLSVDALDTLLAAGLMPNLKTHLIDQGVQFQNSFVTNAVCCPSRATFLTGLYSHNHKVLSNSSPNPFRAGITWPGWFSEGATPGQNESTIATWLKAAGYFTGYIGKYLNGYGRHAPSGVEDPTTYIPPGWDDWQGLIDPTTYRVYDYELNDNGTVVVYGTLADDYQTDVLSQRAVDFIAARAFAGQPFLLVVAPLAPHIEVLDVIEVVTSAEVRDGFEASIRPAPRHEHLIDGDLANGEVPSLVMKPSFNEEDMFDKPSCPVAPPSEGITYNTEPNCVGDRPALRPDQDVSNVELQYKAMLASMVAVDDLVGAVMDTLEANGISNETVVVFTSDNGWFYGEHRLTGKELPYEESIRVPLIIRAPGYAVNATASQVVLNNDLAPTLAELGETSVPYDPDGSSLVRLLEDPARTDWHRKFFLIEHWFVPSLLKFELASYAALRGQTDTADFLYVAWRVDRSEPQKVTHQELYNLRADPHQTDSLTVSSALSDRLQLFLSLFRTCGGATCRALEAGSRP